MVKLNRLAPKPRFKIKSHWKVILFVLLIVNITVISPIAIKVDNNQKSIHILQPRIADVIGSDDREMLISTTSYPWSTIVKLHITWGAYYTFATGALIDKNHVLTAAHCVYSHSHGGYADNIKIVPGEYNGIEPFGYAWAIKMRCYDDWKNFASPEQDFALLTLDRDIGLYTGWMGLYTTMSSSSTYSRLLNTAGYPAELDYGLNMYWTNDYGYDANEYNHWYYLDTTGGQSGSPVWIYDNGLPYIISIVTSGYIGLDLNYGTRINQNKYYCIQNWINSDETLTDKPDLASEYNQLAGYNTNIVGAGLTPFEVWSKIRNLGTSSANNIRVSFYASQDTTFTNADYLIGSDIISSLSSTSSKECYWSGMFPSNVPSGNYYIGWIIDPDNLIDEFKENNNYNFIWSSKLLVDATLPLNPTECIQLNGTTENNVLQSDISNPDFSWIGATDSYTDIAGYYYYWGVDPYGTSTSFTSLPSYDPPAINNGTYYLRVCTEDIVGNVAPWTTLYVFKYENKINNTGDDSIDDPIEVPIEDPSDDPIDNPIDDSDEDPNDNSDDNRDDEPNRDIFAYIEDDIIVEFILIIGILSLLIFLFIKVQKKRY